VETEKAEVVASYGAKLKSLKKELGNLAKKHREGTEWREVQCHTEFNWVVGIASVIREDTWETVSTRSISDDERQMHIDEVEDREAKEEAQEQDSEAQDEGFNRAKVIPGPGTTTEDARRAGALKETERDDKALRDLLSLVMDRAPTLKVIKKYNENEYNEVLDWATRVHLEASDHDIEVPQRPALLGG
jgi:hypothetical protein